MFDLRGLLLVIQPYPQQEDRGSGARTDARVRGRVRQRVRELVGVGFLVVARRRDERGQIAREMRKGGGRGDEGIRQDVGRGRRRNVTSGTTVTEGGNGGAAQRACRG